MKITCPAKQTWMFWKRKRHLIALLAFFGYVKIFILRVSVSVAVVAMTSPYNVSLANGTVVQMKDFDWNTKIQSVFLSAFSYGQIIAHLIAGWLASRLGGARLFGWGLVITSFLTTITPPIAYTNLYLLLLTRAMIGFFEGMASPCMQEMWARWAPPQERSTMTSVVMSGVPIGTVLGFQLGGLLTDSFGWEFIFYYSGFLGLVWSTIWLLLVKDYPENDPRISPEELKYIQDSIGKKYSETKKVKYPWVKMFTSLPAWSIAVCSICEIWGHAMFSAQLPTFIKDVFNFRLTKTGFILSMPYIVMGVTLQFSGRLADWLQNKNILTTTQVRKLFGSGGFFCQAFFLFLSTNLQSATGVLLCLIVNGGVEAFVITTITTNGIDLSPLHASVIFSLSTMMGYIAGVISTIFTGFIVVDHSEDQWHTVFYIVSAVYVLGGILYGLFGSGEKQPWAEETTSSSSVL